MQMPALSEKPVVLRAEGEVAVNGDLLLSLENQHLHRIGINLKIGFDVGC